MTTAETHALTGAYVLDAIGDFERAKFERHLRDCEVCAHEVRELRAVAALLGVAADAEPPARLRSAVLARITATRQAPPLVHEPRPAAGVPRRWRTRAAIAVAAAAAVAAGVVGGITLGDGPGGDRGSTVVTADGQILAAPDAVTVTARAATGGTGTAEASRSVARVAVSLDGVATLDPAHAYQVWLIGPRGPRSAGLLRPDAGPLVSALPADVDHIAVTTEPATGSPRPTTPGVLRLDLG
ncbi:anti-sigma factor [Amycolatopsis carbonis]|uniref:Regulator of SigK n=1 Tax=Amycolatopsis carbonis TaxID=715471 RepID=A0A9Y2IP98_9PSEU|nr:anti-sigma factor [Amycolatopsis sp. 2-15]WIX82785.1 anti-sigma factor [Amycolatopsis sp. 2-15]